MFELSQLRCFVAVGEELHFGRAALRLGMGQPPLSRQIQLMEHTMGVLLFERTSRSVRLTPAGRGFLSEARQLLRLADGAELAARRVARGDAGTLTLGFTAGSSYAFLPRLVSACAARMPGVDLALREMPTLDQMDALAGGRLDAGLVRLPIDRRGVDTECVAREALLLAAPEGHDLLRPGGAPGLRDFDRAPVVMYSPAEGRFFFDLVSGLFRDADVGPRYVQHVSQVHTVLALVSAGMGIALVPESARSLVVKGVGLRDLVPRPRRLAELHLVWRRDHGNPALQVLRSLVLPGLAP